MAGWLSERFDGRYVLSFFGVFLAAAMVILLFADSLAGYLLVTILLAPADAIWPILWAIVGHQYGPTFYNSIRGTLYSIILYGSLPWQYIPGLIFEQTDSYDIWLVAMAVVALVTSGIFWLAARSNPQPIVATHDE